RMDRETGAVLEAEYRNSVRPTVVLQDNAPVYRILDRNDAFLKWSKEVNQSAPVCSIREFLGSLLSAHALKILESGLEKAAEYHESVRMVLTTSQFSPRRTYLKFFIFPYTGSDVQDGSLMLRVQELSGREQSGALSGKELNEELAVTNEELST